MLSYEYIAYDAINSLRSQRHVQTVHLSSIRTFFKRKLKDEGRQLYRGFDKRLHSRLKDMVEEGKLISDERGLRFGLTSQARKIVNQRKRDGLDVDFRLLATPAKGAGTATPRSSGKKRTLAQSGTPNKKTASGTSSRTPMSTGRRILRGTVVDSETEEDTESEPEQQRNLFDDSPLVRRKATYAQSAASFNKTPQKTPRKTPLRASQTKSRETPSRGVSKRQIPKSTPRRRLHTSNELTQEEFLRLENDLEKALENASRLTREKLASERTQRETARHQKADLAAVVLERDAAINAAERARASMAEKESAAKLAEDKWRASEAKLQELERRLESTSYEREESSMDDFPNYHDENDAPATSEYLPDLPSETDDIPFEEPVSSLAEINPENISSFTTVETPSLCAAIDVTNSNIEEANMSGEQMSTEYASATITRVEEVIVLREQTTSATLQIEDARAVTLIADSQTGADEDSARMRKDYEILTSKVSAVEAERDAASVKITELTQSNADLSTIRSERDSLLRELEKRETAYKTLVETNVQLAQKISASADECCRLTDRLKSTDSDVESLKAKNEILEATVERLEHTLETERGVAESLPQLRVALEDKRTEVLLRTEELENARAEIDRLHKEELANKVIIDELRSANMATRTELEEKATELQSRLDENVESKRVLNDQMIAVTSKHASEKASFTYQIQEMESVIEKLRTEMTQAEETHKAKEAQLSADVDRMQTDLAKAEQETTTVRLNSAAESAAAQEKTMNVQGALEKTTREYEEKLAELTTRAESAEKIELANRNVLNEKEQMVEELQVSVAGNERIVKELETRVGELAAALENERRIAKAAAMTTENLQRALEETQNDLSMRMGELDEARSELCRLHEEKTANELKLEELRSAAEAMRMDMDEKTKEVQSRLNETVQSHFAEKAIFESRALEMESAIQKLKEEMKEAERSHIAKEAEVLTDVERTRAALAKAEKQMADLKLNAATDSEAAQEKIMQLERALEAALENQKNERGEFAKLVEELKRVQMQCKVSLEQVEDMTQKLNEARMQITQQKAQHDELMREAGRIQEARDSERKTAQEALDEAGRKLTETETEREELERRLSQGAELVELMRTIVKPMRSTSANCSVAGTRVDSGVAGLECTTGGEMTMGVSRLAERRKRAILEE